jgi:hypothetical protein
MEYKKTPPQRTPAEMEGTRIGHRFEKLVPDEDNFEIQVWESKDGKFLGYCLRTSLGKIVNEAWREAIAKHPAAISPRRTGHTWSGISLRQPGIRTSTDLLKAATFS